jgi:hypothetical protein
MNRIIVLLFSLILFFLPAFGQDLNTDLNRKFKKYNLVQLDSAAILKKVDKSETALIGEFQAYLETNGLFSNRLIASEGAATVKPVKGKLKGFSDSDVRLTIGDKIKGYIFNGQQRYYIEPAVKYSSHARPNDYIVYLASDVIGLKVIDLSNDVASEQKMAGSNFQSLRSSNAYLANPASIRVIEIATDADYEYVQAAGGATQANNEIVNIINMAEGVYERQLGLTFDIVYQHAWTSPDPYPSQHFTTFLTPFRDHWNSNFTGISRDAAYLFTGSDIQGSPTQGDPAGVAYQGTVCRTPSHSYGASERIDLVLVWRTFAHEVGHLLGADHVTTTECVNTIMFPSVSYSSEEFCPFSINQITNYVNTYGSCLRGIVSRKTKFDFDGDGKADISVFRPGDSTWYIQQSQLGFSAVPFGTTGDKIAPADFDGDGKTDIAVFRPSTGVWIILKSSTNTVTFTQYGALEDKPVPADYDGDSRADLAVFRPSVGVWYYLSSRDGGSRGFQFGSSTDKPVPDDFTGDGKADIAFWRPSEGNWYVLRSENNSFYSFPFGTSGDIPVTADFDGDKIADSTVFRPSTGIWYILRSGGGITSHQAGTNGDIPVPADYDGDELADIVYFRPSNGVWYFINTFNVQFGANGDIPIPGFLVVQ